MDSVVERFHRTLVEEIRRTRPEYLTGPFTVAEIYQNLVPYGSHRDRLGVEMNGDYEDALLRLLAGEGELLLLDSEPALRELRRELERANPDTGLYREYAAVDVRLNRERLDLDLAAPANPDLESPALRIVPPAVDVFESLGGSIDRAEADDDDASTRGFVGGPADAIRPDAVSHGMVSPDAVSRGSTLADGEAYGVTDAAATTDATGRADSTGSSPRACRWCAESLPDRGDLRFCPFCGTDIRVVPCASCGEEVEAGWSYCIACGAEASSPA